MKVYLKPADTLSKAMFRVARALAAYAPPQVKIVNDRTQADVEVLHVIGSEAIDYPAKDPVVVQYCLGTSGIRNAEGWHPLWERARLVWSYYDLSSCIPEGVNFFHSPLGVDEIFLEQHAILPRNVGILTSGYVAGPGAEAIEEVATAADQLNLRVLHLGPVPTRLIKPLPRLWSNVNNIADNVLVNIYSKCRWVSGLRFVEGFELPAAEGLICGARPILFDRPEMRQWYGDHAVYVKENYGEPLISQLVEVLSYPPQPVEDEERQAAVERFSWSKIAAEFWKRVIEAPVKERANEQVTVGR